MKTNVTLKQQQKELAKYSRSKFTGFAVEIPFIIPFSLPVYNFFP